MTGTLHEDLFTFLILSRSVLLRRKNISEKKFVLKIKTHFFGFDFVFRKSCGLYDNVGKYCRTTETPDDNIAHAHCMLYTKGYKHTLTICNNYCFSTAKIFAQTRLSVTVYVHCLSCLFVLSCSPYCDVNIYIYIYIYIYM